MWENSTQRETTPPESLTKKISHAKPAQRDLHLTAQIAVCLLAVLLVLFLRTIKASCWQDLCENYEQMLTQGIRYDEDLHIVRLVNAGVDYVRTATQQALDEIELTGAGGVNYTKKNKVPDTATLDVPELEETFCSPLQSCVYTSSFGFRENPVDGKDDFHMGLDLAAEEGASVAAVLGGQVTKVGYNALRGYYVTIRHRSGLQTLYQHLQCSYVRVGEIVTDGQSIATVGSTGYVTGPHLHLELIVDGLRVDPLPIFSSVLPV